MLTHQDSIFCYGNSASYSLLLQTGTPPYTPQPLSYPLPSAQTPRFTTNSSFCHSECLFSTENIITQTPCQG